jgi:hypothetical protein
MRSIWFLFILGLLSANAAQPAQASDPLSFGSYDSFFYDEPTKPYNFAVYNEYPDIRNTGLKIFHDFPPGKTWYLGPGRSPTPLMAFFEGIGVHSISGMPLSGMRDYPRLAREIPNTEQKLHNHFAKWLPKPEALKAAGTKKILVIDYTASGEGLINTVQELRRYFASIGLKIEVQGLGLYSNREAESILRQHGMHAINLDTPLWFAFLQHGYDSWAKYGSFHAWSDNEPAQKSAQAYKLFTQSLWKEMASDQTLAKKITPSQLTHLKSAVQGRCMEEHLAQTLK